MKPKYLFLIILAILSMRCTMAGAQEIHARHFTMETGLPSNDIWCVEVDDKGFLWMGSVDGLYRFDGNLFHQFRKGSDLGTQWVPDLHIGSIRRWQQHYLILQTQAKQFACFDTDSNAFIDLLGSFSDSSFVNTYISPDRLILGLPSGRVICILPDRQNGFAQTLSEDRRFRDTLYIHGKLIDFEGTSRSFIIDNVGNPIIIDNKSDTIWYIDRIHSERVIPLKVFEHKFGQVTYNRRYRICTDTQRQLIWISTDGCGITLYDQQSEQQYQFGQFDDSDQEHLISTNFVNGICLDDFGNLWVALEYSGLSYLMHKNDPSRSFLLETNSHNLEANMTDVLSPIGSDAIGIVSRAGDCYVTDSVMSSPAQKVHHQVDYRCFAKDPDQRVWIGTRRHGLLVGGQSYRHSDSDPNSISDDYITQIVRDHSGSMWVTTHDHGIDLAEYSSIRDRLSFTNFPLAGHRIETVLLDSRNRMWIGAKSGLYLFTPDNPHTYYHPALPDSLMEFEITSIIELEADHFIIGTFGAGICELEVHDHDCSLVRSFSVANGLSSNNVSAMQVDELGQIWIATTQGISILNPSSSNLKYLNFDHLPHRNNYRPHASIKLPDGRLAFGSVYGINIFDPHNIQLSFPLKKLALTDIYVNSKSEGYSLDRPFDHAPGLTDSIVLDHDQNSLAFHFSSFDYSSPVSTRYSYFLEGVDHQWSESSNSPFVTYRNLSPGTYRLQVRALQSATSQSQQQSYLIQIRHPWWQTGWAWSIWIGLMLVIAAFLYRHYHTIFKLNRQIKLEKRVTEYKLRFFTDISHEFRSPLTIMKGSLDTIAERHDLSESFKPHVRNLQQSVDRMSRLINQLITFRKVQTDSLNLNVQQFDVVPFLRKIADNFSSLALNRNINYRFLPQRYTIISCCDKDLVDKIVYNLLSNAFKYTPDNGEISFHVSRIPSGDQGDRLLIQVIDTGEGVPSEKRHLLFEQYMKRSSLPSDSMGIGLNLSFQLARAHHGQIQYEPNTVKGSIFSVYLPAEKKDYAESELAESSNVHDIPTDTSSEIQNIKPLAPPPYNDRNILIIDDDSNLLDFMQQQLQPYFHVFKANSGESALLWLKEQHEANHPVHLIISDIKMGGLSGIQLIKKVRASQHYIKIPFIMLTADTNESVHLKALQLGADAFITKPYDLQLLLATCSQLIQRNDTFQEIPTSTHTDKVIIDDKDHRFLKQLEVTVQIFLPIETLSIDKLAAEMGIARNAFYRKVKDLSGLTPNEYLKKARLEKARELLQTEKNLTVSEIAIKVGISDSRYFSTLFKSQFGVTPTQYRDRYC